MKILQYVLHNRAKGYSTGPNIFNHKLSCYNKSSASKKKGSKRKGIVGIVGSVKREMWDSDTPRAGKVTCISTS